MQAQNEYTADTKLFCSRFIRGVFFNMKTTTAHIMHVSTTIMSMMVTAAPKPAESPTKLLSCPVLYINQIYHTYKN